VGNKRPINIFHTQLWQFLINSKFVDKVFHTIRSQYDDVVELFLLRNFYRFAAVQTTVKNVFQTLLIIDIWKKVGLLENGVRF